jgi:hypothetical protein
MRLKKLFQKLWWKYTLKLTSAFHTPSLLKARIVMLYRKPSTKVAFTKYSFVLPMLAFCVLVTAFIQRERVLPTTLNAEVGKVAERFGQEMKKAFLPENLYTETEIKKATNLQEINTLSLQKILPTQIRESAFVIRQDTPRLRTWIPKTSLNYSHYKFLKSYDLSQTPLLRGKIKATFSYIFQKYNYYAIQFINIVDNKPIKNPRVRVKIVSFDGDSLQTNTTEDGIMFRSYHSGMHHMTFEMDDTDADNCCVRAVLCFSKNGWAVANDTTANQRLIYPSKRYIHPNKLIPTLADADGNILDLSQPISIKQPLQVIFPDIKDAKITHMSVMSYKKNQTKVFNGIDDNVLNLRELGVRKCEEVKIYIFSVRLKNTKGEMEEINTDYIPLSFYAK